MPRPARTTVHTAMANLGYRVFEGVDRQGRQKNYDINLFGIRTRSQVANTFDDWVGVFWMDWDAGDWQYRVWSATTDPGTYYLQNPVNVDGTAILVEGQYHSSHRIGIHKGTYTALVQNSPLPVFRDKNRDKVVDVQPGSIRKGLFGINIHRASAHTPSSRVDKWSAGCQVLADPGAFDELMDICFAARDVWGPVFSYTLLNETQL